MTKQECQKGKGAGTEAIFNDNEDVIQKTKKEVPPSQMSSKKSDTSKKKDKKPNEKKPEQEKKGQDVERREKEKREKDKKEKEMRDAERRERELEIIKWEREREESRTIKPEVPVQVVTTRYKPRRPPVGYRDPHEVHKKPLPKKVKDEKRQELKALMNCIAFEGREEGKAGETTKSGSGRSRSKGKKSVIEEVDNSFSSDTTSDITDVTPRSTSSGCSSMSKQSITPDRNENEDEQDQVSNNNNKTAAGKRSKSESRNKQNVGGGGDSLDNNKIIKKESNHNHHKHTNELTDNEVEEMRYLQDAFEDFDIDEQASSFATSIISGLSEERRLKCGRKNMSFTNEQLREIERVNLILLKKIMGHKKPRPPQITQTPVAHRKSSAAINRAKLDKKIEQENMILLKKLQSAKSTTGSITRKTTSPTAFY